MKSSGDALYSTESLTILASKNNNKQLFVYVFQKKLQAIKNPTVQTLTLLLVKEDESFEEVCCCTWTLELEKVASFNLEPGTIFYSTLISSPISWRTRGLKSNLSLYGMARSNVGWNFLPSNIWLVVTFLTEN